MNRKTDRQTDRQAHRLALPLQRIHTSSGSQTLNCTEGSGNKTTVLLCVCTVFSVLKLFIVHLAIFTAGSKPTSTAELFPHISR